MDILELLENLMVEPHQQAIIDAAVDEIERLRKDKAELVEELWGIALHSGSREANEMARAAIAKATGGE